MQRNKRIPFTAHVIDGIILSEPELTYIECSSTFVIGCRQYRGYDANYCVIGTDAFTIRYGGKVLANKYFTRELFEQYLAAMCACGECPYPDDNCFLLINGCMATLNDCGLLT